MERSGPSRLSDREMEVAVLVMQGLTNVEISARLGISPWTVKRHLARICSRLGLARRSELAAWVARHLQPPLE